jgi:major structural subunit of bundle-forming pilus
MVGVTLLEIMLVLAIAAMVIVMSIRYYQSASLSQKLNTAMSIITGVSAAAENYLNQKGTYSTLTNATLSAFLPGSSDLSSPWGGKIEIKGATDGTFTMTLNNIPATACTQLKALLQTNKKVSLPDGCTPVTINAY